MENVFKSWLCPYFLLLPKKSELPKIWGGCRPPRPPRPYAYVLRCFRDLLIRRSLPANSTVRRTCLPHAGMLSLRRVLSGKGRNPII